MSSFASIVETLGPWNWWVLAGILLALEMLAPTFVLLWFGAAAAIVGFLMFFVAWSWQGQVVAFAILSIVLLILSRTLLKKQVETALPILNRRANRHVGRVFVLDQAIQNGEGKVKAGDTVWLVRGKDLPKGHSVKVTGVQGTALLVEDADQIT